MADTGSAGITKRIGFRLSVWVGIGSAGMIKRSDDSIMIITEELSQYLCLSYLQAPEDEVILKMDR